MCNTLFLKALMYLIIAFMKKLFRIGEIASLSGLTPRTIRYYMELGLLPEERSKGGQRSFSSSDLVYLKRIK